MYVCVCARARSSVLADQVEASEIDPASKNEEQQSSEKSDEPSRIFEIRVPFESDST